MLEIWLLIALAILVAVVWKPLSRAIVGALDGHAAKVRAELEEAKRLREEAQSLLAEHKRQLAAGDDHARTIVEHARVEAERQAERQHAELEASLARRTEQALARIAQEEARAIQDVRNQAATLAIGPPGACSPTSSTASTPRRCSTARSRTSAASFSDPAGGGRLILRVPACRESSAGASGTRGGTARTTTQALSSTNSQGWMNQPSAARPK